MWLVTRNVSMKGDLPQMLRRQPSFNIFVGGVRVFAMRKSDLWLASWRNCFFEVFLILVKVVSQMFKICSVGGPGPSMLPCKNTLHCLFDLRIEKFRG